MTFAITPRRNSTEVWMIDEDRRPMSEEDAGILSRGWNNVLTELKDHCERSERRARTRSDSAAGEEF